jgi:hypothetical protein
MRVGYLLGQYPTARPHEPAIYTAAVAGILAEYPREIIDFVTDPRTGLANGKSWIPTLAEVRAACEHKMLAARMREDREERERQIRRQRLENPSVDRTGRPSMEELRSQCAAKGFLIGEGRRMHHREP